jgi:hypothetical protein
VVLSVLFFVAGSALATPADEVSSSLRANGIADVSAAKPRQFLKAVTPLLLRTSSRDVPDYVIAAISVRPDLAGNIVALAVRAAIKNSEAKRGTLCLVVERIVTAAITANPNAAVSITRAGIAAAPQLRRCVASAAVAASPDRKQAILQAAARPIPLAFLTFSAADSNSAFSFNAATLSPANISDLSDDDDVASPEQPPVQ